MDAFVPFSHLLASLVFENRTDCWRWEGTQRNTSLQRKLKSNVTKQLHYCTLGFLLMHHCFFVGHWRNALCKLTFFISDCLFVCLVCGQTGENICRGLTGFCSMFYESMCKMCVASVFILRWTLFLNCKWETWSHLWIKSSTSNGTAIKQSSGKYRNILHCPHRIHDSTKLYDLHLCLW